MTQSPTCDLDPYRRGAAALRRRYLTGFEQAKIPHRFTDVLILGAGAAGLSAALAVAEFEDLEALVVAKTDLDESATRHAQGGVAAVVFPERTGDSVDRHVEDSIACAAGLADEDAVRVTVEEGVERVRALIEKGAEFDRNEAGLHQLTREGAHSFPRILHRGDSTGKEIERALVEAAGKLPNVLCLASTYAVDLLTVDGSCRGALVQDRWGDLQAIWARRTILATGGAGRLYRETTNPEVCTGDGVAMAFRAGAELRDLEFVQFHPTTLYVAGADRHLITEAVRGEGGRLVDGDGHPFMERFHKLADLAPRDVVSRSILEVMKETGANKVWLDLSQIPEKQVRERFPGILDLCAGFGIDIVNEPIPVRPSAHYSIGGVATDLDARTSVPRLFAAGEVASTKLHGANRLGSNSILEGLVFGHRAGLGAANEVRATRDREPRCAFPVALDRAADTGVITPDDASSLFDLDDLVRSLKSLLWYKVGVERVGSELESALLQLRAWMSLPLRSQFSDPRSWTVQNMLQTAYLITFAALRREESRGVHSRADFPERRDASWQRHTTLSRDDFQD